MFISYICTLKKGSLKRVLKKSVLVVLPAKDFNETGFLTVKNALESKDIKIFIASDANGLCTGTAGLKVKADVNFYNIHEGNFAALILAGGNGARNYWNNSILHKISKKFFESKKTIAAICSAPITLAKAGLLTGSSATCFPDDKKELEKAGAEYKDLPVVVRKKIITARDEQAALDFAHSIIDNIIK